MAAIMLLIGIPLAFFITALVVLMVGYGLSPALGVVGIGTVIFVFVNLLRYVHRMEVDDLKHGEL